MRRASKTSSLRETRRLLLSRPSYFESRNRGIFSQDLPAGEPGRVSQWRGAKLVHECGGSEPCTGFSDRSDTRNEVVARHEWPVGATPTSLQPKSRTHPNE